MAAETLDARRWRALRQDWSSEVLARFFLLTPEDMLQVRTCRGAQNRLGFALQLLLLRLLHCSLPALDLVPQRIVQFVSMQLEVNSAVLAEYSNRRQQTRDDHLAQIRRYLEIRAYTAEDEEPLRQFLLQRALQRDEPTILLEEAEDWLRSEGILFPAESSLQRLITHVRPRAEEQLFQMITRQLTPHQTDALTTLLTREQGKRGSTLAWLKEPPFKASPTSIKALLKKLETVRETKVDQLDLTMLNRNRVRSLAQLGRKYHRDALERFPPQKRAALLVCFLQELQQELIDDLIATYDDLVAGIFRRAEQKVNEQRIKHGKDINRHLLTMRKVTRVVLDRSIPNDQVRPQVFADIPEAQVQEAYDHSGQTARPEDYNVFDLLDKSYSFLREFLPQVLEAVPFTGTEHARPVLRGIEALKAMDEQGKRKLPAGTSTDFMPAEWRKAVAEAEGTVSKHLWEFCLAEQVRHQLRSSDLHVPGSRQHKAWTSYLHTPQAWAERRTSWFAHWHGPSDPDAYLDALEDQYIATVRHVADTWKTNNYAEIVKDKDGKEQVAFSRDEKLPTSPTVDALKEAILELLPRTKLTDALVEVDDWVGIRGCFTHLNDRKQTSDAPCDPQLDTALFAAILAHGCNLPLATMADAADIPYHHLTHVSDWYLREETIRRAIIALIDYHHALPLTAAFGPGTAASSDGIRFGVSARSLHAQYHSRHFGPKRGVTIHDMTSDQYSHPYLQVIQVHLRESHAALDGLLHHETELPLVEMMTDTHGYTEICYALYELESLLFSPRIRNLAEQRLYPLARSVDYGILKPLFRGPSINRSLIKRCWDDMHRVAASLKDGTVTATLLVSKLQALERKNGIHKGIQELGRLLKTINILTYISDEPYRRRIQRMLNKGEFLHSLARDLFFGQQGLLRERDYVSHVNRATCLSLLINVIAVWNTRYMYEALGHLRAKGSPVNDADVAHLSPLLHEHMNFHGAHHFDLIAPLRRQGNLRPLRAS